MKRFIIGAVAGAALFCLYRKLDKKYHIKDSFEDELEDIVDKVVSKARRDINNVVDKGRNQAEYIKERIEKELKKGKSKYEEMAG